MDTIEAGGIRDTLLRWYRELGYEQLASLVPYDSDYLFVIAPSGVEYNVLTRMEWCSDAHTSIRVAVEVDDGDYGDQVCGDFVMGPRGQCLGGVA